MVAIVEHIEHSPAREMARDETAKAVADELLNGEKLSYRPPTAAISGRRQCYHPVDFAIESNVTRLWSYGPVSVPVLRRDS